MKKIKYFELLPIIAISFFLYRLLNEKFLLTGLLSAIIRVCIPIFWAIAIAYVVNIAMRKLESKFKLSRTLSLIISYLLVFTVLTLLFALVIPALIKTVPNLVSNSPTYVEDFNEWYDTNVASKLAKSSSRYGLDVNEMITSKMEDILQLISDSLQGLVAGFGRLAFSITTGLIQFFIGVVISVYVLNDKENFFKQSKKLSMVVFGEKITAKLCEILKDTDVIFGNYLIAKSIDSAIIGVIAVIGFKIMGLQYAILFGLIVGITNMIPYFGPIIGAVPVVLITVFISPIQALWAIIFILVLQQIDGNIIGPKIVGEKLGLPSLWGVVSVTVGGTIFGFWGMLLGTPLFAVFRKIILDWQDKKLVKMKLAKVIKEEEEHKQEERDSEFLLKAINKSIEVDALQKMKTEEKRMDENEDSSLQQTAIKKEN